jgi:hypothetical protein
MSEAFRCNRCQKYLDVKDKELRLRIYNIYDAVWHDYEFCSTCAGLFGEWITAGHFK